MKYDYFLKEYKNYTGIGIKVTCPYTDENYGCHVSIIGLEDGGGIQNMIIMNKNNICVPKFLPDVWYPKINPKDFKLNKEDVELLNEFELAVLVEKESVINYLSNEDEFIKIIMFPNNESIQGFRSIKPEKFNDFLDGFDNTRTKEFKKKDKIDLDKFMNPDIDLSLFK